ncbi:MAG: NACHT domain-containing protein [Actinobacteria bacterium]|nr:MAG: NACHT domain-containing protein [Actinomycetota bacterium]
MALLTDQLVGRAEELGSFEQALDEVDTGNAAAVELLGEPGIGKSRLLAEFARHADTQGRLVLAGSASELERDLPFAVFVDALDEYLRGLDLGRLKRLDEDVLTELAQVFPSLSSLATAPVLALPHERYRTHRAVRALFELLANTRPLLLILDDFHWADSASVELLGALLRRPPAAPVLVAVAVRPHQLPERLAAALERAHRAGALTRVELGALTQPEARELVGERVDVLYEESGGNPFYLEQLSRSATRESASSRSPEVALTGIDVPPAVAASLNEELALLSDGARRVLEGAAVAGDPFEPELAAAAADTSEPDAMDAVDELLQLDLVRETDVPRRFRFRHPLVRRAVYDATPGGWRLGAHERCAQLLARRGATAAARAHHVQRSAREGDADAVAVLREAGEETLRLGPASAAQWFADALRLLPHTAVDERIELLRARSAALTAVGRFADSHEALLEALQAGARLASAIQRLSDQASEEAVTLMNELTVNLVWRARYEEMYECAERAVSAARQLGDAGLTATALTLLTMAGSMMGEADRAEANWREATALVDSLSDDELARHLESAARLAGTALYIGRYAEGEEHAARALAVARETGQGELVLVLVATLGGLRRLRGKLAEAGELLDGGIEAARLWGNTHALVWMLLGRSAAALHAGDLELALVAAQEAFDLSANLDEGFHSAEAAVDLARALLEAGEPQRAVDLLLGSAGASALQLPMARAWADRAAAAVDLHTGDATTAAQRALAAAAAADEMGAPVEAALSRTLAGRALAQAGEPDRATAELEHAAGAFEESGALRYRDEAEQELRKLGHRIHRRTRPGKTGGSAIESLTERELQIARLVVDRKTNPEIAAELFLSQKTVETHLRNIFRKVNVSSRVELARTVERADRVGANAR